MSKSPGPETRARVIARDGFACRYCASVLLGDLGVMHGRTITLDHRIPKVLGGTNDPANLLVACAACNQRKGDDSSGWHPYPPRHFDDAVERALLFHAQAAEWTSARIESALALVRPTAEIVAIAEALPGRYERPQVSDSDRPTKIDRRPHREMIQRSALDGHPGGMVLVERPDGGSGIRPGRIRVVDPQQRKRRNVHQGTSFS